MARIATWPVLFAICLSGCGSTEASEPECPTGKSACGGACVNLLTDVASCGACGHACPSGVGCFAAACTSPSPMPSPRTGMVAVTLPDGRIAVMGGGAGNGASSIVPGSVEIYDPAINAWSVGDPMPTRRVFVGAALREGRVLVAGGQGLDDTGPPAAGKVFSTVELYDPIEDTWENVAELVEPRQDAPMVVTDDGRAWVIWGGRLDESPIESIEVLAPGGSWSLRQTNSPPARWGTRAFPTPDGRIYVVGGVGPQVSVVFRRFVTYDPVADVWEELPETKVGHGLGAAALGLDGRVYVGGGLNEFKEPETSVERYDPITNTWSTVASLPFALVDTTAATGLDGRIYVMGGTAVLAAPEGTDTMLVYDPELDEWFE